ncbi:MAG: Disulfide bond formation protein D [Chroococcidiopsis cubana SAG 39.79]|uniref:Thioredoxin-like fold domain-containing protein n=1 Tax=Chroococcidiopsis cubana SAG 39.79 TaxID=388085 RepID=A0AB37U7P9_9CYAN|nr:thioredoxin domain-containing protein [Chroococcidiopsis cubana]MDZ4877131.1 Disulfide bond formation protein D [Chroococcidiopsis cubana SAG 39.79]PSB57528.1 disulfide bond formation protein DsbA [Chroococcidiopsis cubana CCALA 043]RUS95269.1 hypothetical protein DSM107010_71370 [Chroococcidiopsis cubana SAG 39.79]
MLLLPVHQNDYQLGPIDAPVQLVEYGDFACRHCRAVYPVINQIKHWLSIHLCFVFRHFPISDNHLWAWQAAELAEAAGAQGQFWQMHRYLFEHPSELCLDTLTVTNLTSLGLDPQQLIQDIGQHRYQQQVQEDILSGLCSNVRQTPTFFINGVQYQGVCRFDELMETIETAGFEQEQH